MTVGIDFYMVDAEGEVTPAERYVKFEETIHDYLWKNEKRAGETFDLLLDLDRYGDRLFSRQEINELKNICEALLEKYEKGAQKEQKIRIFASELKRLCMESLEQNQLIMALGD
ncbi:MAG TPA: hypothetical protein VNM45_08885 [Bacillus sp. (in: firmicutes)]|nr:hypothetical protein [Bacillus sp. (in: firmicutes)]